MNDKAEFSGTERAQALELIGRIYDGALNARVWPDVVRDAIGFIGGSKGVLFTPFTSPENGGFTFTHQVPESFVRQRAALYAEHDIWTQAAIRKKLFREGNVIIDAELVPERELLDSVFYREFLRPQGIARLCVGIVFGQETVGMTPTICSAMRDVSENPFGERERDRSKVILPHLSRALGVMFRLRNADLKRAATLAAIDRLAGGVVLADERGLVLHANRAAQRLLREHDGLTIREPKIGVRGLFAASSRVQSAIESTLKECLSPDALNVTHFSRGVRVPRLSGAPDYVLQFAPLPAGNDFRKAEVEARAIVFLTDPAAPLPLDPSLLKKLYGLTPAEIRLALELAAGATVEAASSTLDISANTARSQLKRIFAKTSTHRQADFMRLLVSLGSNH